ncbi:3-polyprenyl-4-hydroxybenzoate decarboxylase [Microbacterium testaceum StLB037]|uniref:3-polyprenyl-4-hydroxybenzoate decarboxylase n=1 Tax=Microbacterium testaceum (strain StLB037) TaxID=979556 RepID=E8N8Q0_MICTS|nr:suppressor of fused domain protein [Microbacterium testaceum]BAJ75706.1 3-polyprenyl-4-hydroxybenzoate decarboxylase [Microbacterium testaceum StLB037]
MGFLDRWRQNKADAASGDADSSVELGPGEDTFAGHVFDALGIDPVVIGEPIGGSVLVVEKRVPDGPIVVMTSGASRLPTDSGEQVELAVEVVDGQQGAARVALSIVCDDIAAHRRVPPVGAPWRNDQAFLNGTRISAILATPSRWGAPFDEVRSADGALRGHVRTLRLLTDAEAATASAFGWDALVDKAGSIDAFLDVTRGDVVESPGLPGNAPVFVTKLHAEHPPRWVTFTGGSLESVTGLESQEFMDDAANHEIWSVESFLARFPQVAGFARQARPGQTALFADDSGAYTIEEG